MGIMIDGKEYNPRYVYYAHAHGKNPEQMLKYDWDNHRYMIEFMIWNRDKWREFDKLFPEFKCGDGHTDEGHVKYDEWLKNEVGWKER